MTTPEMMTPKNRAQQTMAHNMTLVAHHELDGFGGMGEGIAMQKTDDGRRILWMAHESAPKNFTGVDVTDPKNPRVIVQTELPHMKVRSNSLDVVGNLMVVANQTKEVNMKPAGFNVYDISSAPSSTPACVSMTPATPTRWKKWLTLCRVRRAWPRRARFSSTTCLSMTANWFTPWTALVAACTSWK